MKTRSVAEGIWNDYRKRLEREVEQERLVLNERCNHTPDEVISAAAHIERLNAIVGAA